MSLEQFALKMLKIEGKRVDAMISTFPVAKKKVGQRDAGSDV